MRGRGGGTVMERDTEEGTGNGKGSTRDEEAARREIEEGRGNGKGEDRRLGVEVEGQLGRGILRKKEGMEKGRIGDEGERWRDG
jgi:hypothetical protein